HIDTLRGKNTHHQIETVFKAFGRALRMAIEMDERMAGITPSTKGLL
ncbi:MAG: imidazoleglycerol-phosphate dehydratase, partial [Marinobacter sp.]|nr:imidazoleglycerol-phosphate dehydratase [Marinobacter sp.]MBQ0832946.1 imidazoleglycerol-phosphate dehydratase [Marinobacter sp.]